MKERNMKYLIIAMLVLTAQAFAEMECQQTSCGTECEAAYSTDPEYRKIMLRQLMAPYYEMCGKIAEPTDRKQCYTKNITYNTDYPATDSSVEMLAKEKYILSAHNPDYKQCVKTMQQEYAAEQQVKREKRFQEDQAALLRHTEQQKADLQKVKAEREAYIEENYMRHVSPEQRAADEQRAKAQEAADAQAREEYWQSKLNEPKVYGPTQAEVNDATRFGLQGVGQSAIIEALKGLIR